MSHGSLGDPAVRDRVVALLERHGVAYRHLRHEPVRDAEHAAALRGMDPAQGGKALLLKAGRSFVLVGFQASRRMDNQRVRHALGVSKLRFATREELFALTGLVPGCVPPLGEPVLSLPLWVDRALLEQDVVAFTPGLLTDSFVVSTADYLRVAAPRLGDFTDP